VPIKKEKKKEGKKKKKEKPGKAKGYNYIGTVFLAEKEG